MNGSLVEMPWLDGVGAVLETYLGGQACGGAVADILFGDVNPSGKLAETFPVKLEDNPSFLFFPGEKGRAEYREGIFVAYRYYEKKKLAPLFPFGYGLSYSRFEYTAIAADRSALDDTDLLGIRGTVRNAGPVAGKEIVQLYVRCKGGGAARPEKELRSFVKVSLEPGEENAVGFTLDKRAFAYYDVTARDWLVETGDYEILAGASSADTPLRASVRVNSTYAGVKKLFTRNATVGEVLDDPVGYAILSEIAGEALLNSMPPFVRQMPLRSIHTSFPDLDEDAVSRNVVLAGNRKVRGFALKSKRIKRSPEAASFRTPLFISSCPYRHNSDIGKLCRAERILSQGLSALCRASGSAGRNG